MCLSACLHTLSHPRSFIQSANTGTEGSFCLSTICQDLYSICTYSSFIFIIFELLKIITQRGHFLRKLHWILLPSLHKKINFMPNHEEKTSLHFLYTTLPFVLKIGQTSFSFHFVQMACLSKQKKNIFTNGWQSK